MEMQTPDQQPVNTPNDAILSQGTVSLKDLYKAKRLLGSFVPKKSRLLIETRCLLHHQSLTVHVWTGAEGRAEVSVHLPTLDMRDLVVVDYHVLMALAQNEDKTVVITARESNICVSSLIMARYDFKEWPMFTNIGEPEGKPFVFTQVDELKKLAPAMSEDKTRPNLSGVNFSLVDQKMLATNGHCLLFSTLKNTEFANTNRIIARELIPLITKSDGMIIQFYRFEPPKEEWQKEVPLPRSYVVCESEDFSIVAETCSRDFPDYQKVIPTSLPRRVECSKSKLHTFISQCKAVAGKSRNTGIKFHGQADCLEASYCNSDGIEVREKIPALGAAGLVFGVDFFYLDLILKSQTKDHVVFHMGENEKSGHVEKLIFLKEEEVKAVVMPMLVF